MRWNGFGSSLGFALVAAAGWPLFALVAGPLVGASAALSLYLVCVATVYSFGATPDRARGLGAAALTGAIASAFAALARDPAVVALGAAIGIGLARSALLHRRSAGRAIAVEVPLLGVGLLLARFLSTPGPLGVALALWGFFLVQSVFFAIGGASERIRDAGAMDPFEGAKRRAMEVLEGDAFR